MKIRAGDTEGPLIGDPEIESNDAQCGLHGEKRLSDKIIESLPGVFYAFNREGKYLPWNKNLERVSGYSAQEISELHPLDFFEDKDKPIVADAIEKAFVKGRSFAEAALVSKDGRKISYQFTGTLFTLDQTNCLLGMGVDITEKKQAEEDLQKSERKYRPLFEESRDGVCAVLRDGEITEADQSFLDLFGYTRTELIGQNILEWYVDPADRSRFQEEIERVGFVKDYEVRFRKKDGTQMDCLLTLTIIRGEDESILGYRGIVRDISQHRQPKGH